MSPDLVSPLRWAPALPHFLWLRTSPPDRGGLRRCHVSYGSEPRLPIEVGSSAATCPIAPDLASRLRWASTLPRVPRVYAPRASSIKKNLANLPMQLGTHILNTRAHVSKAPHIRAIMRLQYVQSGNVINTYKACGQTSTVRLQYSYSATPALWTTRLTPLQCQVTRQYDATLLTECSVAGDKTRCAHTVEDIICYS
jgi:hypothetical protein